MTQIWYSASELAALNLPGMPVGRTNLLRSIASQKWNVRIDKTGAPLARKRVGRGGGFEYHIDLLPQSARAALGASETPLRGQSEPSLAPDWAWYETQSTKIKKEAELRLTAICDFEKCAKTSTRSIAVRLTARKHEISEATLWNWLGLIEGVKRADRLPALAPRRKGGGAKCDIDPEIWQFFKSDFLRASAPTYAGCYERLRQLSSAKNLPLPHIKTLQRRLEREIDRGVIILKRQGVKPLMETVPAQKRTIAGMNALDLVVVDGHKWNVFVKFPAKHGQPERISRPISVVIQDNYSRKILAWRTGETENTELTQLAFADLFEKYGIPRAALLDNGRAFASKRITGGAKTRFRFKINDADPLGLLTSLGIKTHWATPGHGQAKPIERAFKDLQEGITKHPICEGAFTGHHIDHKPENHGTKSVDLEVFEALIAKMVAAHNARIGRRTEAANGGSFDEAFNASYMTTPIGRATPEQMRMALLCAESVRTDRKTGAVIWGGNRYWANELQNIAGDLVTIRFDMGDYMKPVHIYKMTGEYICEAPIIAATGFLDMEAAKAQSKLKADYRKRVRALAEVEQLISAPDLSAMLPIEDGSNDETPTPSVLRPVRARQTNLAQKILPNSVSNADADALLSRFDKAMEKNQIENEREERAILKIIQGGLAAENIAQFGQ